MSKRSGSRQKPSAGSGGALDRAVLALRAKRPLEAERLALECLNSDPRSVVAAQVLGEALLVQGRPAEAVEGLQRLKSAVLDAATETLLAMALEAAGRSEEALLRYRRAATSRPPSRIAVLRLARSLDEGGEFEQAIALLESALGSLPESDAHPLKLALGHLQLKVNNKTGARRTFSEVFKAAPSEGVLLALARVLVLNGEFDTACGLYRHAARLRPEDPSVLIALAKCLLETGDRKAGEAILRAAARQEARAARLAVEALAATPHGRFFLRPSAAARFMGVEAV